MKLAVVTGASSGIGLALAREFARQNYDLAICANEPEIREAARELRGLGVNVFDCEVDLATRFGVETFHSFVRALGRPIDALALNAGTVVYGDFARHNSLEDELELLKLNVVSVVHLSKLILPSMIDQGEGRVLITSSIAALMPGPLYATYAASKAFLLSFSEALRNELQETGVTVTCLMPGATDTKIFERAGMSHTVVGEGPKDSAEAVAKQGFEALMKGADHILAASMKTKIQGLGAKFLPERVLAVLHRQKTKSAH